MPVRTAWRMHSRFGTGSMPGIAASTRLTWLFGSAPNAAEAPENSLALEVTCACTSRPMTTSQVPVRPSISNPLMLLFSRQEGRLGTERRRLLDHPADFQDRLLVERLAQHLQPQRQ